MHEVEILIFYRDETNCTEMLEVAQLTLWCRISGISTVRGAWGHVLRIWAGPRLPHPPDPDRMAVSLP